MAGSEQRQESASTLRLGAVFLFLIGAAIFTYAVTLGRAGMLLVPFALVCFVGAGYFSRRGKQLAALSASELLSQDQRGPVLYLRAFKDDEIAKNVDFSGSSLFEDVSAIFTRQEEFLAEALAPVGPVIALGNPGEALPGLGAAREYVDHGAWQQHIRDYMAKAGLVVFQIGNTENLIWEFKEAVATVAPERLILFVPKPKVYETFRQAVGEIIALPQYPEQHIEQAYGQLVSRWAHFSWVVTAIIYFAKDRQMYFVPLALPEGFRQNIGTALTFALRPAFAQLGVPWQLPPRKFLYRTKKVISGIFFAIFVVLMLGVAAMLIYFYLESRNFQIF